LKRILTLIIIFLFVLSAQAGAVDVFVNDTEVLFDSKPKIVSDRTMVPMRAVFEAMGAQVSWDDETNTATGTKNGITVSTTLGSDIMYKNGEPVKMDCAPFIENDRTYVPIRFIAQCFGALVSWTEELLRVDVAYATEDDVSVHFIDVGQGDTSFVELPGDRSMLIDTGTYEYGDTICDYINALGYNKIDYVVATHPHADHIGAMAQVFREFDIINVYMPNAVTDSKTFEMFLDAVEDEGCNVVEAKAGVEILKEDNLSIKMLAPKKESYDNLNDYSAIVKLTYGEADYLFTGDAEAAVEKTLLGDDIEAEVFKAGHHGSSTSNTEDFIRKVDPEIAVISCGADNSYGHPHRETLALFEEYGVEVFRTDEDGTVVISTDGKNIFTDDKAVEVGVGDDAYYVSSGNDNGNSSTFEKEEKVVYITLTGSKYHTKYCSRLKSSIETSLSDAVQNGLEACSVCNP